MNTTQIQTTAAPLVAFLAGLLAGKGVFGLDAATWTVILGSVGGTIVTVWAAVATRKPALINTVAALPEVKTVELDKTVPGTVALNHATSDNVVLK